MKRAIWLAAVILAAGCAPKRPEAPKAPGGLKVGLLVSGPVSDHGWNGLAHDAGQELARDTGAQVQELQTKSKGEIEAALRDFAARGFDLVIGHGNEYGDPALKVAKDFPKTKFLITSGRVSAPNVASLVYKLEDATYCVGILAAGLSKTGKVASVGGVQYPVVQSTFDGLRAGALTVNPKISTPVAYINSWDDAGAAKQQTSTLISQGADVIFHNADAAGLGVFQAVQEADKAGKTVYAFGSNADQNAIAPDVVVASAVMDLGKTFDAIAAEVKAGTFQGKPRVLGMKDGFVSVSINAALEPKIPPAILKKEQAAEAGIRSGKLVVKQSA
ncbi:MAG TPA: BMP family protein [Armatimonadota bacterium]